MKKKGFKQLLAGACAAVMVVSGLGLPQFGTNVEAAGNTIAPQQDPMKIKFDEPLSKGKLTGHSGNFTSAGSSTDWWQQLSLPIGNSFMGANVYGEVEKEQLTFNHKTLWNGGPSESQGHTGGNVATANGKPMAEYMQDVQNAFLNKNPGASDMCGKIVGVNSREYGAYQGWGDIYLDFDRKKEAPQVAEDCLVINNTETDKIKYGTGWAKWEPKEGWVNRDEHYCDNPTTLSLEFTGTRIDLIGAQNNTMGDYVVKIDGEQKASGTMYSATKKEPVVLFSIKDLPYGPHKLEFESKRNTHGAKSSIDCFKIYKEGVVDFKGTVDTDTLKVEGQWGMWDREKNHETDAAQWFGKDEMFVEQDIPNAQITYKFTGTGFELFGAKNTNLGILQYKVDNDEWKEVNTYGASFGRHSLVKVENLDKKEHTVIFKGKDKKLSLDGIVTFGYEAPKPVVPESEQHTEATNYERALDLDNAIATVSYDRDFTHYDREYFASHPDNVIAMKLTAKEIKGSEAKFRPLTFEVSFPVDQPGNRALGKEVTYTTTNDTITVAGKMRDNGLKMNGKLQVVLPANADGKVEKVEGKDSLLVSGAKEVYIYVTADTDYKMVYPTYRSGETDAELATKVSTVMSKAVAKGYNKVKEDAVADYKNIFDRVKLDIGQEVPNKTIDQLLADYKANSASASEKAYVESMVFQFGRYLQISSSREDDRLPANLQGVWLDCTGAANSPVAWGSDYHMNVNFQMNYWPTYVTNMAECAEPMIKYMEGLREPGRKTASTYFGIDNSNGKQNGFSAHTQNTPFGWTCPGWDFYWGWSPAAVPWMLQNVYEAYEYSGNVEKLEKDIFPMMREEAKFYMQILKKFTDADGTERYVTVPAYSPEHGPYTAGNVYENVLVWQLFNDCIEAAEALNAKKAGTVPAEEINQWKEFREGLKPIEVGASGQIKEWYDETTFGRTAAGPIRGYEDKHRHMSHLLGVFPGDLVNVENTEYINAAKKSLERRGDNATGWGIAQRLNTWARTGDGDHSYQIIDRFVKTGLYSNLWDSHAPFQIDGNFGFTSGVAEMLMQSNAGYINLLPAMPKTVWQNGAVKGLVARGNFEVGESWTNGALTTATVKSNNGGECKVQTGWEYTTVKDSTGKVVKATPVAGKEGRVSFPTTKGETYTLTKGTAPAPSVESVLVVFKADDKNVETKEVVKGEAIGTLPTAPAKEGFTFKEWNTQADGKGTKVTAETKATKAMTVFAVYEEIVVAPTEYTVTFMNGTEKVSDVKVEEGKAIGTLPADPTKEGHTFKGWNTAADGKGDVVTAETKVTADMTVYAVFEKNAEPQPEPEKPVKYTVTFDVDGKTTAVEVAKDATIGDKLPTAPVKDGYTFKGWNTQKDGKGEFVTAETKVTGDMTVYAVFTKKDVKPPVKPEPEKPSKPSKPAKPNKPAAPTTGDAMATTAVASTFAVAVLAIAAVLFERKRRTR